MVKATFIIVSVCASKAIRSALPIFMESFTITRVTCTRDNVVYSLIYMCYYRRVNARQ